MAQPNIQNMLRAISNGNHVFNEQVKLYRNTQTPCPDCEYDPIRKESTTYCETCGSTGNIITLVHFDIPASVETEDDFKYEFSKAGKFVKGQIFITIDKLEVATILNLNPIYDLNNYVQLKAFVDQYDYIIWKGAKYNTDSFEAGWLEGNFYEIGMTLSLME